MKRLDLALTGLGLAPTRSKAQQLIEAGDVEVLVRGQWQVVTQSSFSVTEESQGHIRVRENNRILKYVSRGGLKLEGALAHLKWDVRGWRCLDLGISTGGFSDCLLQSGAAEVCGVDVGHGQLHASLLPNPKLKSFEGVNVKDLKDHSGVKSFVQGGVDLCVADLSFISLLSVLKNIAEVLPPKTRFLGLVKPQFEVGAGHLNKSGVVVDSVLYRQLEERSRNELSDAGFVVQDYFPSLIKGQDGNQEFFCVGTRG